MITGRFEKTDYIEEALIDKVTLWMLRLILYGEKDINSRFFKGDTVLFLGLDEYNDKNFDRDKVIESMKERLHMLESQEAISSSKILATNLNKLSNMMGLNGYEKNILEFAIILDECQLLEEIIDFGYHPKFRQLCKKISNILDIPFAEVTRALQSGSKLISSSLIVHDPSFGISSSSFAKNMLTVEGEITLMIQDIVKPCPHTNLTIDDYAYISEDVHIITSHLRYAIERNLKGVNILFYGKPGTGKTELAKVLAKALDLNIYEISYEDSRESVLDENERANAYKVAQAFLSKQRSLLLCDEAEDILSASIRQDIYKAWLTRSMETNSIPTIWITNDIDGIDNAIIRRFDYILQTPAPNRKKRVQILLKYAKSFMNAEECKRLVKNKNITPAIIEKAVKVSDSVPENRKSKVIQKIINNTLKAQGYGAAQKMRKKKKKDQKIVLPKTYNPAAINTDSDLDDLVAGIKSHQNARLCLYGPPGTGKSAYGTYIAHTLGKKLIIKKGSDLLSMWIGETEKNIAAAFKEAKKKKAVLIFDEVDSFLANRRYAQRNWEITQVNEMLIQMEQFEGIFIATTNLMDNLDSASLRRFDLKLEFGYLSADQAWMLFLSHVRALNLPRPSNRYKQKIEELRYLTPGDFAAIMRQNKFRPITDAADFFHRLKEEEALKGISRPNVVGF